MATSISPVKGDDIIIELDNKTIYHATSHSINLDAEFQEYQTKDTGGKVNVLTGHSGTAQTDGLVCLKGTTQGTTEMSTPDIIDAFNAGKSVVMTVTIDTVTYTTTAWITSVSLNAPVAQNGTYTVSLKFNKLEKAS